MPLAVVHESGRDSQLPEFPYEGGKWPVRTLCEGNLCMIVAEVPSDVVDPLFALPEQPTTGRVAETAALVAQSTTADADALPGDLGRRRLELAFAEFLVRMNGQHNALLPMTFGMLADEGELRAEVASDAAVLGDLLARFEAKDEVVVSATADMQGCLAAVVAAEPKLKSLAARADAAQGLRRQQMQMSVGELASQGLAGLLERDAALVQGRLSPLSADHAQLYVAPATRFDAQFVAFRHSFLVPRKDLDQFNAAVVELGRSLEGRATLATSEPIPPFSYMPAKVGGRS